jgi:hypothetical protein
LRGQTIEEILDVLGEGEIERRKDLDQRFRQLYNYYRVDNKHLS